MPRLAANLAYLFTERPLMERFAAAAAAGFTAVELQFPYDQAPSAVKAEIRQHGLTMLGINTPLGRPAGEFGLAAVPGRERGIRRRVQAGARLRGRDRRQRDPLHGRHGAAGAAAGGGATFIANLTRAPIWRARRTSRC